MEFSGPNLAGLSRQSKPLIERRHSVRHRVHSPAYATLNEPSQAAARDLSEILDISEDGMSIQTSSPLQAEHNLNLCLDLSETAARMRTAGQVVWSDSSGRAGIRFPKLSEQALGQLKEWLFVNILIASDNALATPPDAQPSPSPPGGLFLPQDGLASEIRMISGNGSGLAGLEPVQRQAAPREAVQREVEQNGHDRETTLQLVAERALTLTRATGAAIALAEGGEMICLASAGSDAPPFGSRLELGSGFSAECVRVGRSLRCDDSEVDDRVDRAGCRSLGIRSMVAVPIRFGNRVAGLLEVFSAQPYAFNAQDISALQQLTGSILAAAGHVAEVSAPAREIQKVPPTRTSPPRVENRPVAEVPAAVAAKTVAAPKPSQRRMQKVLLMAAILTFAFAVLWLIAPWVSSTMRTSEPTTRPVHQAQASAPKQAPLPANVTDLASLRRVAQSGDPAAQFALGARYATGEQVPQDYTEAVRWFTLAAEQGHILAQATLGAYYWAGRGVAQDLTKAYFWSVLARAGGDQASKYRVAVLTSRMTRSQVLAAQEQANDWLRNHQVAGNIPASD